MFGRKSDPDTGCRVYEYGCLPPVGEEVEGLFITKLFFWYAREGCSARLTGFKRET